MHNFNISKTQSDLFYSVQSIFSFDRNINFESFLPIFTIFGTIFAYFSIVIVNYGYYSRYVSNEVELKKESNNRVTKKKVKRDFIKLVNDQSDPEITSGV